MGYCEVYIVFERPYKNDSLGGTIFIPTHLLSTSLISTPGVQINWQHPGYKIVYINSSTQEVASENGVSFITTHVPVHVAMATDCIY